MKKKNSILKFATAATMALASIAPAFAQSNLGQSCGCPAVASRTVSVNMSTLAVAGGAADGDLLSDTHLTCDKIWVLDKKIYVPNGVTLTIDPGTVVKGKFQALPANATCLVVSRGGKIIANGSPSCQIVFTAEADNLDGTYPIANISQWGGLLLAGRATNNLTSAANGPFDATGNGKLCIANGVGTFEGFASSDFRNQWGANLSGVAGASTGGGSAPETFNDFESSGVLRYVSVRHSGAILSKGGEINGISFGSVGSGTVVEHVEVISSGDDNMELWGGKVNVKYATFMFGNDDMFDWDDSYSGKAQFLFSIKTPGMDTSHVAGVAVAPDADNGFEMDADDQKSNLLPRAHPIIYNATFIGNDKRVMSSDNSGIAAIEAKELTEGEIYNSIFANFRYGLNLIKALGTGRTLAAGGEAWDNWQNGTSRVTGGGNANSLKVKCNGFVGCTKDIAIDKNAATAASHADSVQFFTTDMNVHYATIPGFTYNWAMNGQNNTVTTQYDAVPNPALTNAAGCPTPSDEFFEYAPYKGAFSSTNGQNWMSTWAYAQLLNVTKGLQPCPTDINADGLTDNVDFLQLVGQFNQSCH